MAAHNRIGGIVTATVTPFRSDFTLDENGITRNTEVLVTEGADVIVALGSIGEHCTLDAKESRRVIELTVVAVAGRVPVVATAAGTDWRSILAIIADAAQLGADVVMVPPPSYFPLSADELVDFYKLVDSVHVPFISYSNPTTGGSAIRAEALQAISTLPHFRGAKDATPDPNEFWKKQQGLGGRWPLIAAAETQIAYALLAGADGILTATTTFAPRFLKAMWQAAKRGDWNAVAEVNSRLMPFRRLVDQENAKGSPGYLAISKAAMELRGLAGGPPRPPVRALPAASRALLANVMTEHLGLQVTVPA